LLKVIPKVALLEEAIPERIPAVNDPEPTVGVDWLMLGVNVVAVGEVGTVTVPPVTLRLKVPSTGEEPGSTDVDDEGVNETVSVDPPFMKLTLEPPPEAPVPAVNDPLGT
jgi:hypothetical protein